MIKNITIKDLLWGYFAQFLSIASGLIVLPLVLWRLTPEEVGFNYLMLTISSIVSLLDFGFAPQFSRNFAYIYAGANELKKEGITEIKQNNQINYKLLAMMIETSRSVYKLLAFVVLAFMLSFGTYYI